MEKPSEVTIINKQENTEVFIEVLRQESDAIKKCSERISDETVSKLINIFQYLSLNKKNLVLSGIGKSGIIAKKIAATFSSLGLPSYFLHPIEAMHGDLGRINRQDAIVLISKSGTTEELLALSKFIQIDKKNIIAIVGNPNSPIAKISGVVLDSFVEKEACINDLAPTTSTTVALALGDAMAVLYENISGTTKNDFALNHPAGLLGKSLTLTVKSIMIHKQQCGQLTQNQTLKDAIIEMTRHPVGMAAIVKGEELLGIITDGDIRRALLNTDQTDLRIQVSAIMNTKPTTVPPDTLAINALNLMEGKDKKLNILPIVREGRFEGCIRIHDIFTAGLIRN